jgi:hypothetical protein
MKFILVAYLISGVPSTGMSINWEVKGDYDTRAECIYARSQLIKSVQTGPKKKYECHAMEVSVE